MDGASDPGDSWSDDTQRGVLGDMLGTHMEAVLLLRGCECGCCEAGLNPDMLGKLTALVRERPSFTSLLYHTPCVLRFDVRLDSSVLSL